MKSPQRIAVTSDFSLESHGAFAPAAALARKTGAKLHVVHVAATPFSAVAAWPDVGPGYVPAGYFEDLEKKLRDLVAGEPAFAGLNAEPRMLRRVGDDPEADFIRREGIDLAVVASHGRSGWRRFLLGSFAENLVRTSPCPVLVFSHGAESPGPPAREFAPRRILVGHDFAAQGQADLEAAREWARLFGAAVRFHYVIPDEESLYTAAGVQVAYRNYVAATEARAKESFAKVIAEGWGGLEIETRVTVGIPADAILASAKEFAAELIVLGTHVKPRVDIFRIGSIALRVIRHAPCPVLAVRMTPPS